MCIRDSFTGVPCVVDLAAMRDAIATLGGDPTKINPLQPVAASYTHLRAHETVLDLVRRLLLDKKQH